MTQNRNHYKNQYQNDHHDDDDDRARARAREEALRLIIASYTDNIAPRITRVAINVIMQAMDNGIDTDSIIMAIEQTGLAPQPSPRYLAAILRNWQKQGYVSQNWKRTQKQVNPALDYAQRDYNETDWDRFLDDQMREIMQEYGQKAD